MDLVADRDDQVLGGDHVVDVAGLLVLQRNAVATGDPDRAGVRASLGGMGAGLAGHR